MKYLYTFHQSSVFYRPCADYVMIGLLSSIHVTHSSMLFHRLLYVVDCINVYLYIMLLIYCVTTFYCPGVYVAFLSFVEIVNR